MVPTKYCSLSLIWRASEVGSTPVQWPLCTRFRAAPRSCRHGRANGAPLARLHDQYLRTCYSGLRRRVGARMFAIAPSQCRSRAARGAAWEW